LDWDTETLKGLVEDGVDLAPFWTADELAAMWPQTVDLLTDEDDVPPVPVEPVSKLGDLYILGDHRLLCGDSTCVTDVERLMGGQKADMVFTDPPYNIDYQGVKDRREKIKNDKMSDSDFVDFLSESLPGCETMYVCCSWQYAHLFRQAMERIGRKPKAMIVWDKINPAQHLDKYFKQHEIIFYYGDFGGHKTVRGDVWSLKRQRNTVHPTMKPVELIELALEDQPGKKIVLDSFGGSGSTLIACEKTGRHCRMMEIDPKYCDVIVARWEQATGKKAVLSAG
jgi:DNA modification methylase